MKRRSWLGRRRRRPVSEDFARADAHVAGDDYLRWLCRIVGGFLDEGSGNLRAFDHALRQLPAGAPIIEIGSFLGLSTLVLAHLAARHAPSSRVFSCDPWLFEGTEAPIGGVFDAGSERYRDYARRTFRRNVETFATERAPHSFEMASNAFFDAWSAGRELDDLFGARVRLGGPIGFAYIDGNHTYEAAHADFAAVDRHLASGGFVLFDDSEDNGPFGSTKAAREVAADPRYELVFQRPNHFFRRR